MTFKTAMFCQFYTFSLLNSWIQQQRNKGERDKIRKTKINNYCKQIQVNRNFLFKSVSVSIEIEQISTNIFSHFPTWNWIRMQQLHFHYGAVLWVYWKLMSEMEVFLTDAPAYCTNDSLLLSIQKRVNCSEIEHWTLDCKQLLHNYFSISLFSHLEVITLLYHGNWVY